MRETKAEKHERINQVNMEVKNMISRKVLTENSTIFVQHLNKGTLDNQKRRYWLFTPRPDGTTQKWLLSYYIHVITGWAWDKETNSIKSYSEDDVLRDFSQKLFGRPDAFDKNYL